MLPVQVRVVSSSSCTLSEASALLESFLSSDACADSFARDYVAHVAQSLQDSISRRAGGRGKHSKHRHFPASSDSPSHSSKQLKQSTLVAGKPAPSSPLSKLHSHGKKNLHVANKLLPTLGHTDEKQSSPAPEDVGRDAVVAMEVGSAMPEAEGAFTRHKKKRRHSAVENGLETALPSTSEMEGSAYMHRDRKRRKKDKHERETERIEAEDYGPDDQNHHDKKKRKEEQEIETENAVTEYSAHDSPNLHEKKRRQREKQGRYMEDMETTENRGSLLVDENLDKKSACKAKKKVEVCYKAANNVGVSITPLSSKLEEQAGSSKKKKEDKAFLSATPVKGPLLEKNREETAIEASPLEFESLASEEKKKTKKKKRRKEELGELVTMSG